MKVRFEKVFLLILVLFVVPARGQCQSTNMGEFSRYQLIFVRVGESGRIESRLFRIDRFNGFVSVYQEKDEKGSFVLVDRERPADDIRKDGRVNYQMAFSRLWPQRAFLINVNTGITWKLRRKEGRFYFEIMNPGPGVDKVLEQKKT